MNPIGEFFGAVLDVLGGLLAAFYTLIPNYGISIILLTLVVSLLLFPLTLKQTRSMQAMQELQPEIKKLQKEYKADRQELNQHLMALYKERGVNPAAGCLPLIAQMPIWFALFRVLGVTVENGGLSRNDIPEGSALAKSLIAGRSEFLSMDLLIRPSEVLNDNGFVTLIPYLVLILIVVGSGFYQQVQMTRRRTPEQQQQTPAGMQGVMKVMPLLFGFFSWNFPTGLVVYFAVSNLFRVGQQSVIMRIGDAAKEKKEEEGKKKKAGRPNPGPSTEEKPEKRSGQSPHTRKKSNKRKKRRRK